MIKTITDHLDSTRALARHDSPDTSKLAAATVNVSRLENLVLDAIASYGPTGCISDEVRALVPGMPYSSITARFSALLDKGLIEDSGQRRRGYSRKLQRVLRLSKAGINRKISSTQAHTTANL